MKLRVELDREDITKAVGEESVLKLLTSWELVGKSFGSNAFTDNVDNMKAEQTDLEGKVRFELVSQMILTPESAAAINFDTSITGDDISSADISIIGESIFEVETEELSVDPRTRIEVRKRYESDPDAAAFISKVCDEIAVLTNAGPYDETVDKSRRYRYERYIASSFIDEYNTYEKLLEYFNRGEVSYGTWKDV